MGRLTLEVTVSGGDHLTRETNSRWMKNLGHFSAVFGGGLGEWKGEQGQLKPYSLTICVIDDVTSHCALSTFLILRVWQIFLNSNKQRVTQ